MAHATRSGAVAPEPATEETLVDPSSPAGLGGGTAAAGPGTGTSGDVDAAAPGTPVVLRGAGRDYGSGAGVFDVDLVVRSGTILGIVGPSGAGKTTLVRLITGALDPSTGRIRVLGEDPRRFRRRTRERIGYMPQLFSLYPDLTADENVDFVASLFGMLAPRRRLRTLEVLQLVQLWDARDKRAGRLSGGMQRRLALACALVHEPQLLLLDEPTAGIDPILRRTIWDELHRLKAQGRTLLVTTQYVSEAEECDAVALVEGGRIIALGAPEEIRRRAAGGDLVEAETEAPFDPAPLAGRAGLLEVESTGLRTFRAVAEDAGIVIPTLDDLVAEAGGRLLAAREIRLTFDEVFTRLVERSRNGAGASDDAEADAEADNDEGAA